MISETLHKGRVILLEQYKELIKVRTLGVVQFFENILDVILAYQF